MTWFFTTSLLPLLVNQLAGLGDPLVNITTQVKFTVPPTHVIANKIDKDDDKCHLLLALIGAPTYKLLSSLCAPKQPGELKFKDICDTLKKHYLPQPIKIAERYRFYNRKQLEGESAADYLAQL